MGESTYYTMFGMDQCLEQSTVTQRAYSGQDLPVLGSVNVQVEYGRQAATLLLIIVKGTGASLFERNWLEQIHLQ